MGIYEYISYEGVVSLVLDAAVVVVFLRRMKKSYLRFKKRAFREL